MKMTKEDIANIIANMNDANENNDLKLLLAITNGFQWYLSKQLEEEADN